MRKNGQVLIGAILGLAVLAIGIAALISYIQNESTWSVKQQRMTGAFEIAEAGAERAYQQLIISTTTLHSIEQGNTLAGYNFDQTYTDLPGGSYEIRLAGDPVAQTITITSVGRDTDGKELRAIKTVYSTPGGAAAVSIYAINSASIQGNPTVEWGPVISPGPITTDASHTYPRYYSGGLISPFDANAGSPPNTDNLQWWSYYSLPAPPQIDLAAYKAAAGAACTDQADCLNDGACSTCYYTAANYPTYNPGTNNHFCTTVPTQSNCALIVEGNLSLSGNYGNGSVTGVPISPTAWKEYGSSAATWSYYRMNFDGAAPLTYAAAVSANYAPSGLTYSSPITKAFMHGFLYIGGTISISGGGNGSIIGSMYVATVADLGTSHVTVYYDDNVISNIKIQSGSITRSSWQEVTNCSWTGTHPTCP